MKGAFFDKGTGYDYDPNEDFFDNNFSIANSNYNYNKPNDFDLNTQETPFGNRKS